MEQIVHKNGSLYYGKVLCQSPDEAYRLFREDYHKKIGKDANRRLNREGQRTDVLHWHGFFLTDRYFKTLQSLFGEYGQVVSSSVIGILCTSYCRTIQCRSLLEDSSGEVDEYLDWILAEGSNALRLVNRKNGLGRTRRKTKTLRK